MRQGELGLVGGGGVGGGGGGGGALFDNGLVNHSITSLNMRAI